MTREPSLAEAGGAPAVTVPPAQAVRCPVVLACDRAYAMPLATALRSLAESSFRSWPIEIVVLHDGLSETTKARIAASMPDGSLDITWIPIGLDRFAPFGVIDYVSRMTYARLLLPWVLGPEVSRAVYLDADVLVLGDVAALRCADLGGAVIGAVADLWVRGDGSDRAAGVPKVDAYFNAGMMLIDLERWRTARVSERAFEYLRKFPASPYSDQDALNVACRGRWVALDPRWNFQAHIHVRIDRLPAPERPFVIHFVTRSKPWKPSSVSHNAALYGRFRDRTMFGRSVGQRMLDRLLWLAFRVRNRLRRVFDAFVDAWAGLDPLEAPGRPAPKA